MRLSAAQARESFDTARVARLATLTPEGRPHLVPIVFARVGEVLYSAVDDKPKRTRALVRLANIAADPRVAVLADYYAEDWAQLWWVRADGTARTVVDEPERRHALRQLVNRYAQYRHSPPGGPVLAVEVARWTGWRAAPSTR